MYFLWMGARMTNDPSHFAVTRLPFPSFEIALRASLLQVSYFSVEEVGPGSLFLGGSRFLQREIFFGCHAIQTTHAPSDHR